MALNGGWDSGLTSVLDVLRTAQAGRARLDPDLPELEYTVVTPGAAPVTTAGGLLVTGGCSVTDAAGAGTDLLLIPAMAAQGPATVVDALMRDDVRALHRDLRHWAEAGGSVAAACTSTFLLAEAGLLDGRSATTTWWLRDLFAQRYPKVALDMSRMVVRDGAVITAGAAFAHIDLALNLVSHISPRLAAETARALLIDERPTPSVSAFTDHLRGHDSLVSDFETWARAHLHHEIQVADAALALGVTRRTLERHVRERLGTSPYAFLRALRAERAVHLRATTSLPVEDIARRVGYRDAGSVRRLLTGG
ncbi:helix-turn-helix domain-containing protein [Streptomyces sp. NPDC026665]|uniref:GlxA family transcriptional regulator n=1 Tax=Streptomyces sp. NPDC026665 TaxID=3154798 RepID=UPI0033DE23F7